MKNTFFLKIFILIKFINMITNENNEDEELLSYMRYTLKGNHLIGGSKMILCFEFIQPKELLTKKEEENVLKEYPSKIYLSEDFLDFFYSFDYYTLYYYNNCYKNKFVDDDYDEFKGTIISRKYCYDTVNDFEYDLYKFDFHINNYKDHIGKDIIMYLYKNEINEGNKNYYLKIRYLIQKESNEKEKIEIYFLVDHKKNCYKMTIDKIFDKFTLVYKYDKCSYRLEEMLGKKKFLNKNIDKENDIILERNNDEDP